MERVYQRGARKAKEFWLAASVAVICLNSISSLRRWLQHSGWQLHEPSLVQFRNLYVKELK
jgi:hypothetical protein